MSNGTGTGKKVEVPAPTVLTNRQKLRILIHDKEKRKVDEIIGVGDDIRQLWTLEMIPVKSGSQVIVVNSTPQVAETDYTLDTDTGLLSFLDGHIPADKAVILAQTYSYYAFSHEDLDEILLQANNVLLMAAAQCLRTLATDAARFFIFTSGDEKIDKSKICSNFLKVADKLEARAKAIPASAAEHWEVELEEFGDIAQKLDLTKYLGI